MQRLLILLCLFLTGCGPRSLEDFREEGEGITRTLIHELKQVHSHRELVAAAPRLKPLFNNLGNLMISAREFQKKHPNDEVIPLSKQNHELSDQLRSELNRLYSLDGCREVIERCQEDCLF